MIVAVRQPAKAFFEGTGVIFGRVREWLVTVRPASPSIARDVDQLALGAGRPAAYHSTAMASQ